MAGILPEASITGYVPCWSKVDILLEQAILGLFKATGLEDSKEK